jgi:hypothetical protein
MHNMLYGPAAGNGRMKTAEQKLLHKGCCMKKLLHERAA